VTNLSGSDADGDTYTYSIVLGNSDGIFGISGSTLIVTDTTNLDYETTSGYVLTVEIDDGAFVGTGEVVVTITNENESSPLLDDATGSVAEDATTGTVVVAIS
jgi:hypothetical protein